MRISFRGRRREMVAVGRIDSREGERHPRNAAADGGNCILQMRLQQPLETLQLPFFLYFADAVGVGVTARVSLTLRSPHPQTKKTQTLTLQRGLAIQHGGSLMSVDTFSSASRSPLRAVAPTFRVERVRESLLPPSSWQRGRPRLTIRKAVNLTGQPGVEEASASLMEVGSGCGGDGGERTLRRNEGGVAACGGRVVTCALLDSPGRSGWYGRPNKTRFFVLVTSR
jgi:hypothetical protein